MYFVFLHDRIALNGPLAQLVERVIRIDEVSGSTPLWSTWAGAYEGPIVQR